MISGTLSHPLTQAPLPSEGGGRGVGRRGIGLILLLLLPGCSLHTPTARRAETAGVSSDLLAPGVVHRAIPTGGGDGIDLIDVDLTRAAARPAIVAEGIKRVDGLVTGKAYTPREWLDRTHALAATNGGYFGMEVGAERKEIVGLLVQAGKVRRAAPPLHGHGSANAPAGRFVRSAFGVLAQGRPDIEWAATEAVPPLAVRCYAGPTGVPLPESYWSAQAAVGCGPTLLHKGRALVTDRQERLVSEGPQARTFVAYDGTVGAPCHFVLGMSSGMTYRALAAFLASYFPRYDKTRPGDAMCLDGGSSTQLTYRLAGGQIESPRETGVAVPDALVILSR